VSAPRPDRSLPPCKDPVPIAQEAGWAPGPIWTGAKNLAPTGIRSPDRPDRSQSVYRLSYSTHKVNNDFALITVFKTKAFLGIEFRCVCVFGNTICNAQKAVVRNLTVY
jgi:hypothetical protein